MITGTYDDPELQSLADKWNESRRQLPQLQAKWQAGLGTLSEGHKARLLARDKAMIPHLSEGYQVPLHRLHGLAEEVAEWRVQEIWVDAEALKLGWALKAAAELSTKERAQVEESITKRERELEGREEVHAEATRRLFGRQPRIFNLEFPVAVRYLAAQRQAEDDAQRQNQAQLIRGLARENDAILDELLALGLSLEEIEELKNG